MAQPVHADTMHGVTRFLQSDIALHDARRPRIGVEGLIVWSQVGDPFSDATLRFRLNSFIGLGSIQP